MGPLPLTNDDNDANDDDNDDEIIYAMFLAEKEKQRKNAKHASQLSQEKLLSQNNDGDSYVFITVVFVRSFVSHFLLSSQNRFSSSSIIIYTDVPLPPSSIIYYY